MLHQTSVYTDGPMGSGKSPSTAEIERRALWIASLGTFSAPVMAQAEHGKVVTTVSLSDAGKLIPGDGLMTRERHLPLLVAHSDCLPIFLWDEKETICGIVHAGWRGLVADVLPEALHRLVIEGIAPVDIRIAIGPHIGPCCFEIQEDVATPLRAITPDAVVIHDGKMHGNLANIAFAQAKDFGVLEAQIEIDDRCTFCTLSNNTPLFASYRRERYLPQNMASVIVLS